MRDSPLPARAADEYSSSSYKGEEDKSNVSRETDTRVPLIEERLNVSKQESAQEATITKEPVTEIKTVDVPVMHEEVTIERRPASETTTAASERPIESKTEMKIPLKKEEVYKLQKNLM